MKKIRAIYTVLAVIAALLCAVCSAAAQTAAPGKSSADWFERQRQYYQENARRNGDIAGVDYMRVDAFNGAALALNIGEMQFKGRINDGRDSLSKDEINNILKTILNSRDFPLNEGQFANSAALLAQLDAVEGLGFDDLANAYLKLTDTDTLAEATYTLFGVGKMTKAEYAKAYVQEYVKSNTDLVTIVNNDHQELIGEAKDFVFQNSGKVGKIGGKIISVLPKLSEIGWDAYDKYKNHEEAVAAALARRALVDSFYDIAEEKINQAKDAKFGKDSGGDTYMVLKNATAVQKNVSFWGLNNLTARWTADMRLKRMTQPDGPSGRRGRYEGTITLTLTEIPNFDALFAQTNPGSVRMTQLYAMAQIFKLSSFVTLPIREHRIKCVANAAVTVDVIGNTAKVVGLFGDPDETSFDFEMELIGSGTAGMVSAEFNCAVTGTDIHSCFIKPKDDTASVNIPIVGFNAWSYLDGWPGEAITMDIGNIFAPLEADKFIKTTMK